MSLFERIRREIPEGTRFSTPARKKPFIIASYQPDSLTFSVGINDTLITVPRVCWDSIIDFLRGKVWVVVGQKHDVADRGTFTAFLDTIQLPNQHRHPDWGSYVVPVLERVGVVEVSTRPRTRIRLR
jgi:hypothetical protein